MTLLEICVWCNLANDGPQNIAILFNGSWEAHWYICVSGNGNCVRVCIFCGWSIYSGSVLENDANLPILPSLPPEESIVPLACCVSAAFIYLGNLHVFSTSSSMLSREPRGHLQRQRGLSNLNPHISPASGRPAVRVAVERRQPLRHEFGQELAVHSASTRKASRVSLLLIDAFAKYTAPSWVGE